MAGPKCIRCSTVVLFCKIDFGPSLDLCLPIQLITDAFSMCIYLFVELCVVLGTLHPGVEVEVIRGWVFNTDVSGRRLDFCLLLDWQ